MGARRGSLVSAWTGFLFCAVGCLSFIESYFRLPLYDCPSDCAPSYHPTEWELSMNVLSRLPDFPVADSLLLLLLLLPLVTTVLVLGCSAGFLVHPTRALAVWGFAVWLTGSIALFLLLPFVSIFASRPNSGYWGMVLSYGLLWGGNRILLTAHH